MEYTYRFWGYDLVGQGHSIPSVFKLILCSFLFCKCISFETCFFFKALYFHSDQDIKEVKCPGFSESISEGDVRWEKGKLWIGDWSDTSCLWYTYSNKLGPRLTYLIYLGYAAPSQKYLAVNL
jgi:hypothetical protein